MICACYLQDIFVICVQSCLLTRESEGVECSCCSVNVVVALLEI